MGVGNRRKSPIWARFKHLLSSKWGQFFLGSLLGLAVFGVLFGFSVVNPTNVNLDLDNLSWINSGDPSQHHAGWVQYRNSDWYLSQIGKIDNYAYPFGLSIVFTDSIPLFAIPLKALSSILPDSFQYLGLFTLLSFMLQGGIAALIMRKINKNTLIVLASTLLFVISAPMINRVFSHTSLTAHWLVLLAVYFVLEKNKLSKTKAFLWRWSSVMLLSTLIHPYFLPVSLSMMLISLIQTHRRWLTTMIKLIVPLFVYFAMFAWLGGFSGVDNASTDGLGCYSTNVLGAFSPAGLSSIFSAVSFSPTDCGTFEGNNFLGVGALAMLALVVTYAIYFISRNPDRFKKITKKYITKLGQTKNILICIVLLGTTLFAVSPVISVGNSQVSIIGLIPHQIESLWAIFRATGRIFWPVYYLLLFGIINAFVYILAKKFKLKNVVMGVIVALLAVMQLIDLASSNRLQATRSVILTASPSDSSEAKRNRTVGSKYLIDNYCTKKHVVFIGDTDYPYNDFFQLQDYSLQCGVTQNKGYYARSPQKDIAAYESFITDELLQGKFDKETLYITNEKDLVNSLYQSGYIESNTEKVNNDKYILRAKTP
jgi:hypothetical protein